MTALTRVQRHLLALSLLAVAWLATILLWSGVGRTQAVRNSSWVTDGAVSAVARNGETIYIGGSFTRVGPPTGAAVAIDASTGAAPQPFLKVMGGSVFAVAPDGSGGWYLGGTFTRVGGQPRSGLAHVDGSGNVADWNPGANDRVRALAVSNGTVFVGGDFTTVGGQSCSRIAALDGVAGTATA